MDEFHAGSISIIVPVLDERSSLLACLQQLQSARQAGHQVIVVDGGSRDGSEQLARQGADVVLQTAKGRALQLNAGAEIALADGLLFLHVDTRLPDGALEAVTAALDEGWHWGRFDVSLSADRPVFRLIATLMNWRSRLSGIATGDQAMFVRRSRFEAVGGFPAQPLMEDIALSRALKRLSPPACLRLRVITSSRRWEQRGVLATVLLMWWLRLAYFLGVSPQRLHRWYYGGARHD